MKLNVRVVFIFLASILVAHQLQAGSLSPYFVSGNVGAGYSSASVATGYSAPILIQYSFGATGAYQFSPLFMAGLSSDFNFINQFSDPNSSGGNFGGTRWNIISPTFGFFINNVTLVADIEFLGDYKITAAAANGATVSYSAPLGGRIRGTIPIFDKINGGLEFEYMTFGTRKNSVSGDVTLDSKQTLWKIGIVASYIL